MTTMRLKYLAQNVVEKSNGEPAPYIGLEDVGSGSGCLIHGEGAVKSDPMALCHRSGDVLFGKLRPYLAKSYLANSSGTGTGELLVMRSEGMMDPKFLFYSTFSSSWLEWAEMTSYGTKMPRTSWEAMSEFRLWVPSLEEQWRIADFLDAEVALIDSLVSSTESQLSALRERLTEFMRVMTTTGGAPGGISTGVSWMPVMNEAWKLRKVGHYFRAGSGATPKSDSETYFGEGCFWVNTGDLRDSVIEKPKKTVSPEALVAYPTLKIYDPGSLVVAMYGATTGRVGILGVPACVNQACCVLSELGGVDSQFAFYWFQAHREEILGLASGGGQPNISQELVRGLRIPSPDVESQSRIAFKISDLASEVHTQEASLKKRKRLLEERKRALITAAVTGQIDVTTARGADLS